jgi:exodeoxyribonuclease VII small subunit
VTNPTSAAERADRPAAEAMPSPPPVDNLAFDDALAELQRTVAELEAGGQSLEASIALYERGVALHERCARLLAEAELRVQRLVERAGGALAALDVRPDESGDE